MAVTSPKNQQGERLFAFGRKQDHSHWLCELHDHSPHGIEARFLRNDSFLVGHRFDTRALAVQWAEETRKAIETDETP